MQTVRDVGVDVASQSVVVACAAQSFAPRRVANEREALRAWLRELPVGSRLGMEATGTYHQLLADLGHAAGMTVYVLNPRDVKKYAEGVGRRGKTDRLDAQVIARYVAREHGELHAYVPRSAAAGQLEQLLQRRGKLVSLQVGLSHSWRGVSGVTAEVAALTAAYAGLLARVDRLLDEAIAALPEVRAHAAQVRTIPGYGALGSVAVAHALQRLPFTSADAFIAHTGLDPRPCDSGATRGRRRLSKRGPPALRTVLHMCGMAASRTAAWRPYYQRQLAKGLSRTEAVVILTRKMARTAYGICRNHTEFDPTRLTSSA
ncbi:MAG: IS110 family transposase [Casimicrobiaceae bacterium]